MYWNDLSTQEKATFIDGDFLRSYTEYLPRGVVEATDPIANYRREAYQHQYEEYRGWGMTTQEAADALTSIFASTQPVEPEPIGDSSDGIAPCGYEES